MNADLHRNAAPVHENGSSESAGSAADYCRAMIAGGDEDFMLTLPFARTEDQPRLEALFALQLEIGAFPARFLNRRSVKSDCNGGVMLSMRSLRLKAALAKCGLIQ